MHARAGIDFEVQNALNMAASVDPEDGLAQMRNAAVMALDEAGLDDEAARAVLDCPVFADEGAHRADAFERAASAWAAGAGDPGYRSLHQGDPAATTGAYAAANPGNPNVAADLDAVLADLAGPEGRPDLAVDARVYAAVQLGDAIYNAETGAHGALVAQVEEGGGTSSQALALQERLGDARAGREALRQIQTFFSLSDLDNQVSRTGEADYRGVLAPAPYLGGEPAGGYPDAIRETIGEGIAAAQEARARAGAGPLATLFVPGPEDLVIAGALAGGARALGLGRAADEAADAARTGRAANAPTTPGAADDVMGQYTRYMLDLSPRDPVRLGAPRMSGKEWVDPHEAAGALRSPDRGRGEVPRLEPAEFEAYFAGLGRAGDLPGAAFNPRTGEIVLPHDATLHEGLHELSHARHRTTMTLEEFEAVSRFDAELYVFEELMALPDDVLTRVQRGDAVRYIMEVSQPTWPCCAKPVRDSHCEPRDIAGQHVQARAHLLPYPELVELQRGAA